MTDAVDVANDFAREVDERPARTVTLVDARTRVDVLREAPSGAWAFWLTVPVCLTVVFLAVLLGSAGRPDEGPILRDFIRALVWGRP